MKTFGPIVLMSAAWLLAALASPRTRSAPVADPPAQTPSGTPPGTGLVGHWQGSLKPAPMLELRLTLELTRRPAGDLAGVMVSLDQGGVRIPLTHVSERTRHRDAASRS